METVKLNNPNRLYPLRLTPYWVCRACWIDALKSDLEHGITLSEIINIGHTGCYHAGFASSIPPDAVMIMARYGDDVIKYIAENNLETIDLDPRVESFGSFCARVLSVAVDHWCEKEIPLVIENDMSNNPLDWGPLR